MKKLFTHIGCLLVLTLFMLPKNVQAENGQMMFVAAMSAFDVVPPGNGNGYGLITFMISEDRKEVFIHGVFTNLSGPAKSCKLHLGSKDTTGPAVIDLTSMINGNRIKGAIPVPSSILIAYALADQLYVDVTTAANPSGEIRGQLAWLAEIIIPVYASGLDVVPPVTTGAIGLGALRFSQNLSRMEYQFLPVGLSGPATSVEIHSGDVGVNGTLITTLNTGDFITGTIGDASVAENILFEIYTNGAYLQLNTTAHPGGEIRGQFQLDNPNNTTAFLNGDQETPPVTSTAKAFGYASIDFPNFDTIRYLVAYTGITPTSAHIHSGKAGVGGSVIIPLVPFGIPGLYAGHAAIKDVDLTSFFKDELYFNIHSTAHPGGEIRGQFQNNLLKSFAFDLCGDQEVPKKTVNGYGAAYVAVNKSNTELIYGIIVDGLTGDATAAHIHDGAFGVSGGVLIGLEAPVPLFFDYLPITGAPANKIDLDGAYVNVHTDANPAGEIRGQIRRILSCSINVATIESTIQDISLNNTLVSDLLILNANSTKNAIANVYVSDLSGKRMLQFQQTNFIPGNNKINLDVNKLSSGFYLLNLVDETNYVRSFKFVKQ